MPILFLSYYAYEYTPKPQIFNILLKMRSIPKLAREFQPADAKVIGASGLGFRVAASVLQQLPCSCAECSTVAPVPSLNPKPVPSNWGGRVVRAEGHCT